MWGMWWILIQWYIYDQSPSGKGDKAALAWQGQLRVLMQTGNGRMCKWDLVFYSLEIWGNCVSERGLRPSAKWGAWKEMGWVIKSHQELFLLSWAGGWILFSRGAHWASSDFLCLKWEFFCWKNAVLSHLCRGQCILPYSISSNKPLEALLPDCGWKTISGCLVRSTALASQLRFPGRGQSRAVCASSGCSAMASFLRNWTRVLEH